MRIKLQEFKSALQIKMNEHFEQNYEPIMRNNDPKRFVICKIGETYIGFLLDLEQGTCTLRQDVDAINDDYKRENLVILLEQLSEDEQKHISTLFYQIVIAENGFDLWKNINLQLDQMPGFWSLFSTLRPLTLELKELLKQFKPDELKVEDDAWIKQLLETLKAHINELLQSVNKLTQQCRNLQLENTCLRNQADAGKISKEYAQQIIKQQTEHLIASKNQILNRFEELQSAYDDILEKNNSLEGQVAALNNENRELHAINNEFEQENILLRQQIVQLLDRVKIGNLQIDKVVASVNSKEKVDEPSKSSVSSKLEFESESLSSKEFNERYKKLRQQSGSANRRDRFWRTNSSDSILSLSRKTVDEWQSPSSVFN